MGADAAAERCDLGPDQVRSVARWTAVDRQARVGVSATWACAVFLCCYSIGHVSMRLGLAPMWLRRLTPVPLFSNVIVSAAIAVAAGLLSARIVRRPSNLTPLLPRLLTVAIAFFAAIAVLIP